MHVFLQLEVSPADVEELLRGTSHSAVKAMKSRIAKISKSAAQGADDVEEGSERRLQVETHPTDTWSHMCTLMSPVMGN